MIVDSSAWIAVVFDEPDADPLRQALLGADRLATSAATFVETGVVVDRRSGGTLSRAFDDLLTTLEVEIVPVDRAQAELARDAYRHHGRGSGSRAALNFGDCFSYALAVARGEPLLFKGSDFTHTDVTAAAL